jgi:hypothetical protein
MPDPTYNELLSEIIAAMPPPYDPAVHVIAKVVAQEAHIDPRNALLYLLKLAADGKLRQLETGVRLPNGRIAAAFIRVE